MEFLIRYNKNSGQTSFPPVKINENSPYQNSEKLSVSLIESKGKLAVNCITGVNHEFLIFGDLIFDKRISNKESEKIVILEDALANHTVYRLNGFFYLIAINRITFTIEVHPSLFNILPVYYLQDGSSLLISSSIRNILNSSKKEFSYSEKYAVEKLLFYYSFENRTLFNEINLIPSCSYIEIGMDSFSIRKAYSPYDLYVSNPEPWRKSSDMLSNLFLNEFENYLPAEPSVISLTGGLDGRTLLSAAIKYGYKNGTFSYGSPYDSDILIPQTIAENSHFHHTAVLLTPNYARESFWADGLEFLEKTDFSGNISRAHYVHSAKILSKDYNYLLSGNFGSELFRSMKSPGVMVSPSLFALFRINKQEDFEKYIMATPSLRYLNEAILKKNLTGIINEVWHYKQQLPFELSVNQKFYTYIFGEVFRKYFGPEIIFQSDYIINRSPFLNYQFIKELLKTRNAGVYYNFNDYNPFSRFHGQILYSYIIEKSCTKLLSPMLDKGYSPGDFLSVSGKIRIIAGYLLRKAKSINRSDNPIYSDYYYQNNLGKAIESIFDSPLLNTELLKSELETNIIPDQTDFANLLSLDLAYGQAL